MELREFLGVVLPPTGEYYAARLSPNGKMRQTKFNDLDQLTAALYKAKSERVDTYYATGTFKGSRKADDLDRKKSWYIDIDCKPGGQYPDKPTAIKAIKAAVATGKLPAPTLIVDSGNGYHLYWAIFDTVTGKQWKHYALALEGACVMSGLLVDTVVTKDAARILRVPGTNNWKNPAQPIQCQVKSKQATPYDFNHLAKLLNPYLQGPAPVAPIAPVGDIQLDDLSSGMPEGFTPQPAQNMMEKCPLMADQVARGGEGTSEGLWFGILHALAFTSDGHEWLHAISENHATYTPQLAEAKWNARRVVVQAGNTGPTKCATFSQQSEICASCEFSGKISSPLLLTHPTTSAKLDPNEMPYPWRNSPNTKYIERADDDTWEPVIPMHMTDLKVGYSNCETQLKFTLDGKRIDTKLDMFVDKRTMFTMLGSNGIAMSDNAINELRQIMTAWIQKIRGAGAMTASIKSYGWTKDGFHVAGTHYQADGTQSPTFKLEQALADIYTPEGDLAPWQACANHLLSQDRPAAWAVVASAFSAPLIGHTGVVGTIMSIVSPESGTGKSTAMKTAQAVWGHPTKGMSGLDDTANSVAHKLGSICNLPSYWDEIREKGDEVSKFMKLLFRLSQGKDKSRLNSNIQQRTAGDWSTILILASNDPLIDHMNAEVSNSDAGAARLFELTAPVINDPTMTSAAARHFYDKMMRNYGNAGVVYAQKLATNRKAVQQLVRKVDKALDISLNTSAEERFWVATMACLIVGAQLATTWDIAKFDVPALKKYLIVEFKRMRRDKASTSLKGKSLAVNTMGRFLHDKTAYTVKAEHLPKPGRNTTAPLPSERQPAVVRIASKDRIIRVVKKDFTDWYYKAHGAGATHIVKDLIADGAIETRGSVDAGTLHGTGHRQYCIDMPLKGSLADLYLLPNDAAIADNSDLG